MKRTEFRITRSSLSLELRMCECTNLSSLSFPNWVHLFSITLYMDWFGSSEQLSIRSRTWRPVSEFRLRRRRSLSSMTHKSSNMSQFESEKVAAAEEDCQRV
ncbi:hypothetical protein AAHE18_01G144200 [Arachis hypogaea]